MKTVNNLQRENIQSCTWYHRSKYVHKISRQHGRPRRVALLVEAAQFQNFTIEVALHTVTLDDSKNFFINNNVGNTLAAIYTHKPVLGYSTMTADNRQLGG